VHHVTRVKVFAGFDKSDRIAVYRRLGNGTVTL
jgi:hypothetical protein